MAFGVVLVHSDSNDLESSEDSVGEQEENEVELPPPPTIEKSKIPKTPDRIDSRWTLWIIILNLKVIKFNSVLLEIVKPIKI